MASARAVATDSPGSELVAYLLRMLAGCALFWSAAALLARIDGPLADLLSAVALMLGLAWPALLAVLQLWRAGPITAWLGFWQRLVDPRLPDALVWTIALTLVPLGLLFGVGLDVVLGGSGVASGGPAAGEPAPLAIFVALAGPLFAAMAWWGWLLDRLQRHQDALTAAFLLAGLGVLWQLALWLLPGTFPAALTPQQALFWLLLLTPLPFSVCSTWLYNSSGGSTLVTWVLHLQLAVALLLGATTPRAAAFALVLWSAVALALVMSAGPRTLSRRGATGAALRVGGVRVS